MTADGDQAEFIAVGTHGAELEYSEIPIATAYADLTVEYRAGGITLDPYCQNREKRTKDNEPEAACKDVKKTFQSAEIISMKLLRIYSTSSSVRRVCNGSVISL